MKVTLTYCNNEKKVSKAGKPYVSCAIKTQEHGDTWFNGKGNAVTQMWQVGDIVPVTLFDEEYNGKMYKKFRTVDPDIAILEERVIELEKKVQAMSDFLRRQTQAVVPQKPVTTSKPPQVVPTKSAPESIVQVPGKPADPRFVLTPEEEMAPWEVGEPTLDDLEF